MALFPLPPIDNIPPILNPLGTDPEVAKQVKDYVVDEAKSMAGTAGRLPGYYMPTILFGPNGPIFNEDVRNEYRQKALEDALNVLEIASLFFGGPVAKGSVETAPIGTKLLGRLIPFLEGRLSNIGLRESADDITRIVPKVVPEIKNIPLTELNSNVTRNIVANILNPIQEAYYYIDEFATDTAKPAATAALRALEELAKQGKLGEKPAVNIVRLLQKDIPRIVDDIGFPLKRVIDDLDASKKIWIDNAAEFALPATKQFTEGVQTVIDRIPLPGYQGMPNAWRFSPKVLDEMRTLIQSAVDEAVKNNTLRNQGLEALIGTARFSAGALNSLTPNLPIGAGAAGLKALYNWLSNREPVINMPEPQQPVINTVPFPPTTTTIPTGTFPPRR